MLKGSKVPILTVAVSLSLLSTDNDDTLLNICKEITSIIHHQRRLNVKGTPWYRFNILQSKEKWCKSRLIKVGQWSTRAKPKVLHDGSGWKSFGHLPVLTDITVIHILSIYSKTRNAWEKINEHIFWKTVQSAFKQTQGDNRQIKWAVALRLTSFPPAGLWPTVYVLLR